MPMRSGAAAMRADLPDDAMPDPSKLRYVPQRTGNPLVGSARGGRVLSALMLPLLLASPSATFGVITTTGRQTGRRRRKCVRVVRRAEQVFLVAIGGESTGWLKNIRANPHVQLRIQGGMFDGIARDPRDPDERGQARGIFCETIDAFDLVACALHQRGRPTYASVKDLHHKWFDRGTPLIVDLHGAR